jgi:hypothetical protein
MITFPPLRFFIVFKQGNQIFLFQFWQSHEHMSTHAIGELAKLPKFKWISTSELDR